MTTNPRSLPDRIKRGVRAMVRRTGFEIYRLPEGKLRRPPLYMKTDKMDRLLYYFRMYEQVSALPGDIVECGIGPSAISFVMLAHLLQSEASASSRMLWGFDSFCGFPELTAEDTSPRNARRGELRADLDHVLAFLEESGIRPETLRDRIRIIPGFFNESLVKFPADRPITMLHIDADLYQSYRDVLTTLFPRVVPGGIVLFDEYRTTKNWPGAPKAIDEYFTGTPYRIRQDARHKKFYLIKEESVPVS